MTATRETAQTISSAPVLPLLGAAMPSSEIAAHREWLWEGRDLELQDPVSHELLDGDWRAHAGQVRELLSGYPGRLGIHGPFWSLTLASRDPAIREVVARRLKTGLRFAGEIGATHMVVHSPFEFFGHSQVAHSRSGDLQETLGLVGDTLANALPLAREVGCTLVVENIRDTHTLPLLTLVRGLGEGVRVSIDVGHAALMERAGGPPPAQWLKEAGDLLGHVHLQDNDAALDRHWAPGEGGIHWRGVFRALREVGGSPRLILEVRPGDLAAGAGWLAAQGLAR